MFLGGKEWPLRRSCKVGTDKAGRGVGGEDQVEGAAKGVFLSSPKRFNLRGKTARKLFIFEDRKQP